MHADPSQGRTVDQAVVGWVAQLEGGHRWPRCRAHLSLFSWGPLRCAVLQGKDIPHSIKRGEVFPASQEHWEDKPLECGALDGIRGHRQTGSNPDPWSCQSLFIWALAKRRTEGLNQLAFYNVKHI